MGFAMFVDDGYGLPERFWDARLALDDVEVASTLGCDEPSADERKEARRLEKSVSHVTLWEESRCCEGDSYAFPTNVASIGSADDIFHEPVAMSGLVILLIRST
ncbi:unnamed protein product [Protopolystoma xenopodis]|uniref:Uncharacterized protein n=1 Tax=Protopolystoma xenopodis TaxID=117903 RepID=A0A3S5AM38_9PLAT|nr:unnamed protein product [Protopolystoma xenopodis]